MIIEHRLKGDREIESINWKFHDKACNFERDRDVIYISST